MSTPEDVIVFDGVCVLCSTWVAFVLRHDVAQRYRFAAMQGPTGRALLERHGLDASDPLSMLLVSGEDAWQDSEAILRIVTSLGGAWRAVAVLRIVPSFVRNPLYRWLARNRYRWFGRHSECMVPSPEVARRFLP
jgi:predicted DCC family thiol-disulfide oxidoreductase YuxK